MAVDFPFQNIILDASKTSIKKDLMVYQGTSFNVSFIMKDENEEIIDVTGFTANSKFREYNTSNTSYTFTCNTAANGRVNLSLTAAVTANLKATRYVYDVKLTDGNNEVIRIIDGSVWVIPSIT